MQNFWDFFWLLVASFFFVAYLMIFFRILGDLFSDSQLSGWAKVLWIIVLIVVPFLSAMVYLIARGQGMAERQLSAVRQAKDDTDAYIQSVAGSSPSKQIADAKSLFDSSVITSDEFDSLKAKALA